MADDLVEGSIYNQIKAMEAWALNAYQESVKKNPKVDVILDTLRKINLQARKLEWRGKGLDNLPKGQNAEDLKKKITQLRAAVVTLRDIKKDKELSNASKRTLRVLSAVATEARKLVEQFVKGLPDLQEIMPSQDKMEDFLRGEGEYASFALDVRRKLWNDFSGKLRDIFELKDYNLSSIDLRGFDLSRKKIFSCNFSKTNLMGVSFFGSYLQDCKFISSNLEGANFSTSNLANTVFTGVKASKVNFKETTIHAGKVSFSGDFSESDFSSLRTATNGSMVLERFNFTNSSFRGAEMTWQVNSQISLVNADLRKATILLSFESMINLDRGNTFNGANIAKTRFRIIYSSDNEKAAFELARKTIRKAKNWEEASIVRG